MNRLCLPIRLIPAHAGSTCSGYADPGRRRAHPRSRGEHFIRFRFRGRGRGSSPLTRGALVGRFGRCVRGGLIPAHAGSTRACRIHAVCEGAHPRSRGEHSFRVWMVTVFPGSSPLTRGAPAHPQAHWRIAGLIPAHAGSTRRRHRQSIQGTAHPRSRGEHRDLSQGAQWLWGSSPLTRGAPAVFNAETLAAGLIPAHAGSTTSWRACSRVSGAHPRSRGEHSTPKRQSYPPDGSSPLTRGALLGCGAYGDSHGLIPAHAGSTGGIPDRRIFRRAHPRSRGEHSIPASPWNKTSGSSPLTRGARLNPPCDCCCAGLIPAHAGSTAKPTL